MNKLTKTKIFSGQRYSIVGTGKSQVTKKKGDLQRWADIQRRVNKNKVRIVKVDGGYAGYMKRRK